MLAQHAVMSNVAEATGGRAVYDYNGLALAAERSSMTTASTTR